MNCDDFGWKLLNFNQLLKHKSGYLLGKRKRKGGLERETGTSFFYTLIAALSDIVVSHYVLYSIRIKTEI